MLVVVAALLAAASPQRIAVMDLDVGGGVATTIGKQLTAKLADALSRRPGAEVIAPDDLRAMLAQEANKQLLGCTDDSCLAEIGGALGVDLLLSGRVSKVGGGFALSLSLVSPDGSAPAARVTETWTGESIALLELVTIMVQELFTPAGTTLTGSIDVRGVADGSRILIDDQIKATTPAGPVGGVETGARTLQVVAPGYAPVEQPVLVHPDRVTTVVVDQRPLAQTPFYSTWWFWTGAVAAVAGGTAAAILISNSASNRTTQPPAGATGVRVGVNADSAFTGGR